MVRFNKMAKSCWNISFVLFLFSVLGKVVLLQQVTINPESGSIVERWDDITITCSASMGIPITLTFLLVNSTNPIVVFAFADGQCLKLPTENNSIAVIESGCVSEAYSIYMTIYDIAEDLHNVYVGCQGRFTFNTIKNAEMILRVNVPLSHVELSVVENITMEENEERNISCSARSRPLSSFRWFISGEELHDNQTIQTDDINSTSTIIYIGDRKHNHGRLYCGATRDINNEVNSTAVYLNIIYCSMTPSLSTTMTRISSATESSCSCGIVNEDFSTTPSPTTTTTQTSLTSGSSCTCGIVNEGSCDSSALIGAIVGAFIAIHIVELIILYILYRKGLIFKKDKGKVYEDVKDAQTERHMYSTMNQSVGNTELSGEHYMVVS